VLNPVPSSADGPYLGAVESWNPFVMACSYSRGDDWFVALAIRCPLVVSLIITGLATTEGG
jgi:hypothetical protein